MARAFSDQQIQAALAAVDRALKGQGVLKSQGGGTAGAGTSAAADATLISAAPTGGAEDELLTLEVLVKG
jgi:predicted deacylase